MEKIEDPKFIHFVNWGFQFLLLAVASWAVTQLAGLNQSVQELNIKMAVVVTRGEYLEAEQRAIKTRIENLEALRRGR